MHSKVIIASLVCALAAGFGNAKAQNLTKGRLQKTEEIACNAPNNFRKYLELSVNHAAAGTNVFAELVSDNYYSRLVVDGFSEGLSFTVVRKTVRIVTPSVEGDYYVTVRAQFSTVLHNTVPVGTIYVYSDGFNAAYSSVSVSEARAIYYRNYAPDYYREMLFGPEYGGEPYDDDDIIFDPIPFPNRPTINRSVSVNNAVRAIERPAEWADIRFEHTGLISKTDIEKDYANFVYGNDDIEASYNTTVRNGFGFGTTIRVHANWYDEDLNAHPLQGVNVGLFRFEQEIDDSSNGDKYTDANGEYSFDYFAPGSSTIEQIDLRFYSKSRATDVKDGAKISYPFFYSIPERILPPGLHLDRYIHNYEAIDYYVNFYPFSNDRAAAYLIADAQTIPYNYVKSLEPNSTIYPVTTYYPANFTSYNPINGADDNITIEKRDLNNFDVLNHEYAHYICKERDLCAVEAPRKLHNINEDLVDRYGEVEGSKLAYSEGLATYIALASQMSAATDLTIPGVGDMVYEDANRNVTVDYNVYKPAGNNIDHYYGVESSITAFLLKALDNASRPYDYIAVGDADMWEVIGMAPLYDDGVSGMMQSMCDYATFNDLFDEVDILAMKEGLPLNY